ncbi:MAG: hypothetical protein JW839_03250 [Candidatus Lokiarchaeota archaeon]|nr:hypothetical protein [Candidatus Lokiarchaeota archaeon]
MSQEENKAAPAGPTDAQVGVKLPFIDLVSAMLAIMVTGLVVDTLLAWGVVALVQLTPTSVAFLLAWIAAAPAVFWALYFVYLAFTVLVTGAYLRYYDKKSPATTKVLKRQFKDKNHPDYKLLQYYHMRGAIIKYSLWFAQKSPFPSLLIRILRYYGHNEIGERVMYENCFPALEFATIRDDVMIEAGTSLSTHVVESLYGRLVIERITIKERAVVGINSIVGPGVVIDRDSQLGDNNMAYQNWPLVKQGDMDSTFFNGSPARQCASDTMFADGDLKRRYLAALG